MGLCTPTDTWRAHPVLLRAHSLDNGALFHGKPHPVLALGSIALPVGVCIAVCQAGHIELLLGRDRGWNQCLPHSLHWECALGQGGEMTQWIWVKCGEAGMSGTV